MRLPQKPPSLSSESLQKAFRLLFTPAVQEYVSQVNTEYYHWDKLRHRPMPEGLEPAEAWWAVKLSRAQKLPTPLKDEAGTGFSYWLPTPAMEILHEVDRGGGTMLALPADG